MSEAIPTPSKKLTGLELTTKMTADTVRARRSADLIRGFIVIGQIFFASSAALKETYLNFSIASSYLNATQIISHIHFWFDRDKAGNLNQLKGAALPPVKLMSSIALQISDTLSLIKLLEGWKLVEWEKIASKIGSVPGLQFMEKMPIGPVKDSFGIVGGSLALVEIGAGFQKNYQKISKTKGDPIPLLMRGEIATTDLLDNKQGLSLVKNALKTTMSTMLLLSVTTVVAFPVVCFLYGITNVSGELMKMQEEREKEATQLQADKKITQQVPIRNKA